MYLSNMHIPREIAAGDSDSNVCYQVTTVWTLWATIGINASESNMHIPGGIAAGDGHSLLLSGDKVGVLDATGDKMYLNLQRDKCIRNVSVTKSTYGKMYPKCIQSYRGIKCIQKQCAYPTWDSCWL